jgi:phage/plasmid-like protein (TIGR03299 family)
VAHQIESNDGMVLVGERAWHGLGLVLDEQDLTAADATTKANIGWRVVQCPLVAKGVGALDGESYDVPSNVANIRADDGTILGVVGDGYHVLQNSDVAEVIDGLALNIETAGSLRGGRDVFYLARLDRFGLGRGGADEVVNYALFANSHDGSRCFRLLPTTVRVVCANTLGMALRTGRRDGIVIRHSASLPDRLKYAERSLAFAQYEARHFREVAQKLVARMLSDKERQAYFLAVYEKAYGKPDPKDERKHARSVAILERWSALHESPKQRIGGIQGSAWAALNAVTEWADHERTVRTGETIKGESEARVYSNWLGTAAEFKLDARDLAMSFAGVKA